MLIRKAARSGAGGGEPYVATPVNFNGSTTYLNRGADLTGNANSKLWTGSFWAKFAGTGVFDMIYFLGDTFGQIQRINTNKIEWIAKNAAGSTILNVQTGSAVTSSAWHHICWSFDLSDTGKRFIRVDGAASSIGVTTYTNDTADWTRPDHGFAADNVGGSPTAFDVADAQMWFDAYADLSVAGNLALLMADGKPVDPAIAAATLGTPIIGFTGPASTWQNNLSGDGGAWTENGTIGDGTGPVEL